MAQYYVIVNENERIPLFFWDANSFRGNPELRLASDDLAHVKEVFKNIEQLLIVTENNSIVASTTEYDGFTSILYLGQNFSSQINGFANELVVTLTKTSFTASSLTASTTGTPINIKLFNGYSDKKPFMRNIKFINRSNTITKRY